MRKFFGFIVITALVCLASSCNKNTPDSPEAALGKFSVAPDKQVYFSTGNLQTNVVPLVFDFAKKQYQASGRYSYLYGTITYTDMFGWSTAGSRYGTCYAYNTDCGGHTTPDYSGSFVDWGRDLKKWRTLSIEEWEYLFSYDTHSNSTRDGLYAYDVTVAGVEGCVILYPDNYKGKKVTDHDKNSYNSEADWLKAEKKGVICLPPTGNILEDGSVVGLEGDQNVGSYWSSSSYSSTEAHALAFNSFSGPFPKNLHGKTWFSRSTGFAVRLVWDADGTVPDYTPSLEIPDTPDTPDTPVAVNNCCFVNVGNLEPAGSQYVVGKDNYGYGLVAYDKDLKAVKPVNSQNLTVEFLDGAGSYFSYSSFAASTYGYDGLYYCFKEKPSTPEGTQGKVRLSYNDGKIKFESTIQLVLPVLAHKCYFVNVKDLQPVADEYTVSKDSPGIGIVAYDLDEKKVLPTDDKNLIIEFLGGASTYFSSESVSAGSYGYKGNCYSFKAKTAAADGQTGYVALTYDDGINKIEKTLKLFYPGPLDKFSVSSSKKVYFPTTGNVLMMCPNAKPDDTSDVWRIANHQYDSGSIPSGMCCITYNSWTGTDVVPKADWAYKVGDSSLRVLSIDEWHYLVSYGNMKNSTREGLVAYGVTVAGVPNCVIIYPDGYKGKIVKDGDTATYNVISDWKVAEKEHVVCLPPYTQHTFGCYLSSSTSGSKTYIFSWVVDTPYRNGIKQINTSERGCVRLVRDVK